MRTICIYKFNSYANFFLHKVKNAAHLNLVELLLRNNLQIPRKLFTFVAQIKEKMTKLSNIATIQTGVFAKTTPNPDTLYLQQSDFDSRGELRDTAQPAIATDNPKHLLAAGDLLLASKGNNNICVIVPEIEQKCVASPSFLVIRLHDKSAILPEFVAWYLNLPTIQNTLAAQARGTSIMSISKATLGELEIPILPIERQRRYIELSKLQKREQQLYAAIAERRKQILEYKMIKNI